MKQRHDRRHFVGSLAAGVAGAIAPQSIRSTAAPGVEPDLVVFNAKVYTVDSRNPLAEAFAVKGDRFVEKLRARAKETLGYGGAQVASFPQLKPEIPLPVTRSAAYCRCIWYMNPVTQESFPGLHSGAWHFQPLGEGLIHKPPKSRV